MSDLDMLDKDECLKLLGERCVGRVLFVDSGMPTAHPVNYLLDGEEIIFSTSSGSKLAAAAKTMPLGFEVDDVDERTHTGWSVVGGGEGYEVVAPMRRDDLASRTPPSWAPDSDRHVIAIPLRMLNGRRLV